MFKRIKLYFRIKSTERQMKYELLSMAYSLLSDGGKYLSVLKEVAETSPDEMKSMFWDKFANLASETKKDV